jgi:hypothetical protein
VLNASPGQFCAKAAELTCWPGQRGAEMPRRLPFALLIGLLFAAQRAAAVPPVSAVRTTLYLSRSEYLDRVQAIWTGQMIAQWTGLQFEHQVASVLNPTPLRPMPGYAPIDDDYYYEMVAIRAFEKYGIHLTVDQLGKQWLENNAGSWGSSEQALLLLKRGINTTSYGGQSVRSSAAMCTAPSTLADRMMQPRWRAVSRISMATLKEQMAQSSFRV